MFYYPFSEQIPFGRTITTNTSETIPVSSSFFSPLLLFSGLFLTSGCFLYLIRRQNNNNLRMTRITIIKDSNSFFFGKM